MWIGLTLSVVRNALGEPDYFIAVMEDIQRRKKAEGGLRQAAAVFTSTLEAVFVTDREGNVLAVNPAFTTISESAEAKVLSKSMDILLLDRDDRAFYLAMWEEVRAKGAWQGEVSCRRRGVTPFPHGWA